MAGTINLKFSSDDETRVFGVTGGVSGESWEHTKSTVMRFLERMEYEAQVGSTGSRPTWKGQ